MKLFFTSLWSDVSRIKAWQNAILAFAIFAIYGMMLVNPTTFYDFNSAKGDTLHVFLTYFFMHRVGTACVAGIFHDFAPMWKFAIGLLGLFGAGQLLVVLFRRLSVGAGLSLLLAILWLSMPVFLCITMYQHGMPAGPLAICADVTALLAFERMRRERYDRGSAYVMVLASGFALSCYEANAPLLLTGMLGICAVRSMQSWKAWMRDLRCIFWLLVVTIVLWGLINYGPMAVANIFGIEIPKSGGAHRSIAWFSGEHSFCVNLKSLFVGLLLNWGYNAFFVIGLRCVVLSIVFCLVTGLVAVFRGKVLRAAEIGAFAISVFAFPTIQCASANFRTYYCFIPFITFSAFLALQQCANSRRLRWFVVAVLSFCAFEMGYETSNVYYYIWKVKQHDTMHMAVIAHDLWVKYGLKIDKPVVIAGGWKYYPTCWEDMRPCRFLPLVNHPFLSYSNMSAYNVPREFYMLAREKVGLVMLMPSTEEYLQINADSALLSSHPTYPHDGYIFEKDGIVIVSLGNGEGIWRPFHFEHYASPNERLLDKTFGIHKAEDAVLGMTAFFRRLAAAYPWTLKLN